MLPTGPPPWQAGLGLGQAWGALIWGSPPKSRPAAASLRKEQQSHLGARWPSEKQQPIRTWLPASSGRRGRKRSGPGLVAGEFWTRAPRRTDLTLSWSCPCPTPRPEDEPGGQCPHWLRTSPAWLVGQSQLGMLMAPSRPGPPGGAEDPGALGQRQG